MKARELLLSSFVALVAVPVSAATVCVNPAAPTCQTTIQAGINAASPGDVVLVVAGSYFENVVVSKPGLTIRGVNRLTTVLDASPNSAIGVTNSGPAIVINTPGVTVSNLTLRNGQSDGIVVNANDALIQLIRFLSTGVNANGISIGAGFTGTHILSNEFRSVSASALTSGGGNNGTIVKLNTAYGGNDDVFSVYGDSCVLSNNRVYQCGGLCFGVVGASAVVQYNTAQNGWSRGISVTGAGALVTSNSVRDVVGEGVFVVGDDAIVRKNLVTNAGAEGIYLSSNNAAVTFNTITNTPTGFGIYVSGGAAVVASNKVTNSITGIRTVGAGMSVTFNTATGAQGAGIDVAGTNPVVDHNRTADAADTGVWVACATGCTGGSVAYNVVTNTFGGGPGIYLTSDAPGLIVEHNSVTRSAYQSYYLDGVGHTLRYNLAQDQGQTGAVLGCYFVGGSGGHLLELNSAARCSEAGFYVASGSNTLNDNKASYTYRNGFEVAGSSNVLQTNKSAYSVGAGFAVLPGASSTTLTGNAGGLGNRVDFCDAGTSTSASGNTFVTTSPSCDIY